mgnify:CR=1 FL=1
MAPVVQECHREFWREVKKKRKMCPDNCVGALILVSGADLPVRARNLFGDPGRLPAVQRTGVDQGHDGAFLVRSGLCQQRVKLVDQGQFQPLDGMQRLGNALAS